MALLPDFTAEEPLLQHCRGQNSILAFFFFFSSILQSVPWISRLSKNVYLDVEALAGSFDFEVRPR